MGNQLIKNYDIDKDPYSEGGLCSIWKIYRGVKQDNKSSGAVSIFLFEKKTLEKQYRIHKEDILVFMRKEGTHLSRLKHPNILTLVEQPLEDTKSMAFITEYIESSLHSCIQKNNIEAIAASEIEMKIHIDEILQVIYFMQNGSRVAHLGISPENIYCCAKGQWKIGGFLFSTQILQSQTDINSIDFQIKPYSQYIRQHPNICFTAPELVLNQPSKGSYGSDVFSLAIIILTMFKCKYDKNCSKSNIFNVQSKQTYEQSLNDLTNGLYSQDYFKNMPDSLQQLVYRMIDKNQFSRPSIADIINCEWLNDPYLKAVKHLEKITDMEQAQQCSFVKGLNQILFKFDVKLLKKRIIPNLMELSKFDYLSSAVITVALDIIKNPNFASKQEFQSLIWPHLQQLTLGKEMSAQTLFLLVQNMQKFSELISKEDLQTYIIPLLGKCFDCQVPKLQELAISQIEFLIKYLDYGFFKAKILPKLFTICTTQNTQVRKNSLLCLIKIHENIDKVTQNDQLLSTLEKVRKMGNEKQICMMMLVIYRGISKNLDIDSIANKLLPSLIQFLNDPSLSRKEYLEYSKTVKQLIQKIDDERIKAMPPELDNNEDIFNFEDKNPTDKQQTSQPMAAQQSINASSDFDFLSQIDPSIQLNNNNNNSNSNSFGQAMPQSNQQFNNSSDQKVNQPQQAGSMFDKMQIKQPQSKTDIFNLNQQQNSTNSSQIGQKNNLDDPFFSNYNKPSQLQQQLPQQTTQVKVDPIMNYLAQQNKQQSSSNQNNSNNNSNPIVQTNVNNNSLTNFTFDFPPPSSNQNITQPVFQPQQQITLASPIIKPTQNSQNVNSNLVKMGYDPFSEIENSNSNEQDKGINWEFQQQATINTTTNIQQVTQPSTLGNVNMFQNTNFNQPQSINTVNNPFCEIENNNQFNQFSQFNDQPIKQISPQQVNQAPVIQMPKPAQQNLFQNLNIKAPTQKSNNYNNSNNNNNGNLDLL